MQSIQDTLLTGTGAKELQEEIYETDGSDELATSLQKSEHLSFDFSPILNEIKQFSVYLDVIVEKLSQQQAP